MHRADALTRPSNRLAGRLAARMAATVGHRPDLYIGDFRMAGGQMATIGIGFKNSDFGVPTAENIVDFVIKASSGKLRPLMSTAKVFAGEQTVMVNVTYQREFLPFSDNQQRFAKIGTGRYANVDDGAVWMLEDNDGTPVLFREAQDSLEEVLREVNGNRGYGQRQASLSKCIGEHDIVVPAGAEVSFYTLAGEARVATVMGEPDSDGYYSVEGVEGKARIHHGAIHNVLRTAELEGGVKAQLEAYFTKMFGDKKYAQELVREASVTGTHEELVAFLVESGMYGINAAMMAVDGVIRAPIDQTSGEHRIVALGPENAPEMVLAQYNGNGFEWSIDIESASKALQG